ncbi:MAG: hypothetical protein Tsb008_20370 [Rhodothalassiaceae bacterium]
MRSAEAMTRPSLSQILGVVLASLMVGFLLDLLDITVLGFWEGLWDKVSQVALWAFRRVDVLLGYIAVGALIVVPVYVLMLISRSRHGRRKE